MVNYSVLIFLIQLLVHKFFKLGLEDLSINITPLVEEWLASTKANRGIILKLTGSQETSSFSYYTKKFFSRSSEFFFKRPHIECQFDDSRKDRRSNFFISSALAPSSENLNTIYLYNRIRGRLVNIPSAGSGSIFLSLYSGSNSPSGSALILHNLTSSVTRRICFYRYLFRFSCFNCFCWFITLLSSLA